MFFPLLFFSFLGGDLNREVPRGVFERWGRRGGGIDLYSLLLPGLGNKKNVFLFRQWREIPLTTVLHRSPEGRFFLMKKHRSRKFSNLVKLKLLHYINSNIVKLVH